MANHMALLARDPSLASTMGENARVRMETFFSMERSLNDLYDILEAARRGKYYSTRFQGRNALYQDLHRAVLTDVMITFGDGGALGATRFLSRARRV